MPRPPRCRMVRHHPPARRFGPQDTLAQGRLTLTLEGLEALRLTEMEGLGQEEAALSMGVSRQTFGRVLASARAIAAQALVEGWDLVIDGGAYALAEPSPGGPGGRRRCRRGRGGGGPGGGPGRRRQRGDD